MYTNLGIIWVRLLLKLFSIAMAAIPFVFIQYGAWIRDYSPFAQEAKQGEFVL